MRSNVGVMKKRTILIKKNIIKQQTENVKIRQSVDGETFVYIPSTKKWHSVIGVLKGQHIKSLNK